MYLGELVPGVVRDETRERLAAIIATMRDRDGIDGLVLGGTELPLILPEPANGSRCLDALERRTDSRSECT